MYLSDDKKQSYIDTIKSCLSQFSEVKKVIIFGSFSTTNTPNDIDIAVIQNSKENFLTLSLRYRKVLRDIAKTIPIDIIPIGYDAKGEFLNEITQGQVVYER